MNLAESSIDDIINDILKIGRGIHITYVDDQFVVLDSETSPMVRAYAKDLHEALCNFQISKLKFTFDITNPGTHQKINELYDINWMDYIPVKNCACSDCKCNGNCSNCSNCNNDDISNCGC